MSNYRESGQYTQCDAVMINGMYCHEIGCPIEAAARRQLEQDHYDNYEGE